MKKLSIVALVAIMLVCLNSCQYKNPALENSQNPMVKEFEVVNLMLGNTKAQADKTLKDLGYSVMSGLEDGVYGYQKKVGDVNVGIAFKLGSKKKVCLAQLMFEPESANTYLKDLANFKDVVTTLGGEVKISTKEKCAFRVFVNSADVAEKMDYGTMLSRIDSSTNGYQCFWSADEMSTDEDKMVGAILNADITAIAFICDPTDYMSYDAGFIISSKKYK